MDQTTRTQNLEHGRWPSTVAPSARAKPRDQRQRASRESPRTRATTTGAALGRVGGERPGPTFPLPPAPLPAANAGPWRCGGRGQRDRALGRREWRRISSWRGSARPPPPRAAGVATPRRSSTSLVSGRRRGAADDAAADEAPRDDRGGRCLPRTRPRGDMWGATGAPGPAAADGPRCGRGGRRLRVRDRGRGGSRGRSCGGRDPRWTG